MNDICNSHIQWQTVILFNKGNNVTVKAKSSCRTVLTMSIQGHSEQSYNNPSMLTITVGAGKKFVYKQTVKCSGI